MSPDAHNAAWIAKGATAGMSYEPAEHAELRMFSENFAEIGPGITLLRRPTSLASCHFLVLTPPTRERASR